ncbi:hypothetical protein HAHE_25820 [Haloferula helveola]|uniref:DUF6851 domain-containing protein n=2 Tax=Haloferula helveola TaxID=490095 RepID=A0ABM7RN87_9BACT|nr:hypothetical protein HAHE_25820 [Haloferula helveola]
MADPSVARQWNEENLAAIRVDVPNPPVHARNLFHVAVAMYDAWAAYDTGGAVGYLHHESATAADIESARREALSYAAYRVLSHRYASSASAPVTQASFDAKMAALGYDTAVTGTAGPSPAALGNRIAASIIAWGLDDGSNEAGGYTDASYTNDQPEFRVIENGVPLGGYPAGADPDRWHPLTFDEGFTQNGIGPIFLQPFVGVTWLQARPFALRRDDTAEPWFDPGPPPKLRGGQAAEYRSEALDLLMKSRQLGDMELIDISPSAIGNHPLGTDDGTGHPVNPATGLPYDPVMVPRGDYGRVLAEFWADGPDSETPPGHWHSIANEVTEVLTEKRIGGAGAIVSDLEWDVKLYFALAASTHDAACAAWSLKRYYDSPRPISMIRFMSLQGQSSDPVLPGYHPEGMPLVSDLVEVVTSDSLAPGGNHEGSGFSVGEVVVFTWPGRPVDPTVQRSLPRWIRGIDWFPFQDRTFVSPAFPGYVSGHSTFSRAAAEVLAALTGSDYFPGGLGGFTAGAGSFLEFEYGPSATVELQWATYFDAADEAGISRRWGGIHPPVDDLPARVIGSECGKSAWEIARKYWDGSITDEAMVPDIARLSPSVARIRWQAAPGLWYRVEKTSDFSTWQTVEGPVQATDPEMIWDDGSATGSSAFYRIIQTAAP